MATNKEEITYVRFVFSANDDLFARVSDLNLCDLPKSIDEYIHLCEDKIRQIYPNVGSNVDVINSDDDMAAGDTYVQVWDDPKDILGFSECEAVIKICERIFEQRNWYKWKAFISIVEAQMQIETPTSIIRWICAKELVNINKSVTLWRVSSDELNRINQQVEFVANVEQLKNLASPDMPIACYLEDMKEVPITTFPEDINLLIAAKVEFDDELFTSDTSLFTLQRKGDRVDILAEHFVNVVEWSLWGSLYPKAADTLQEQARRKCIDCELQLPDGISFSRSIEVSQNLTLQRCIEEFLQPFPKVISDAKFSLKGGLIWDKIYEQKGQEMRFQKEILEPLLRNMGYKFVLPTHGNRGEHGRDFVFHEETKFEELIYYALQAKAGKVSGGANRDIDDLLTQIDRALLMPIKTLSGKSEFYISVMIIAISGTFTNDAEEVIRKKIPKYITEGAIYFWDKHKIQSLMAHYPRKETD